MKYCKCCGKELSQTQRHNLYCSTECWTKNRYNEKINAWLKGEFDGMRGENGISSTIRNYLIEEANYKCELCGWGKTNPTTGKVPLEIHHIDGDYQNNARDNLQVLCPNCHSLTSTFKALNSDSNGERKPSRKGQNVCLDCGKHISDDAVRCRTCANALRVQEKPISREELKSLIRYTPFTKMTLNFRVIFYYKFNSLNCLSISDSQNTLIFG